MENLKLVEAGDDIAAVMARLGRAARHAAHRLSLAATQTKNQALVVAAQRLRARTAEILAANHRDVAEATAQGTTPAFLDRLALDDKRVEAMAKGLEEIAALPDPVGRLLARFERPNGLVIERVATPLGVIGVIFESRPGVAADAGGLCLKAGNAAILRGGSESFHSVGLIHQCLVEGLARGRPAGGGDHARAGQRPRRGRRNAQGLAGNSMSSCRAAARASSPASRRRRACRSSLISKASIMSMSTVTPISPRR